MGSSITRSLWGAAAATLLSQTAAAQDDLGASSNTPPPLDPAGPPPAEETAAETAPPADELGEPSPEGTGTNADVTAAPSDTRPDLIQERHLLEEEHRAEQLIGIRGIFGVTLGTGVTLHTWKDFDNDLNGPGTYMGILFALRAGLMLERMEILLEYAPGTFKPMLNSDEQRAPNAEFLDKDESMYSFLASVGYHIPVTKSVYWPLRLGAGVASSRNDMMARIDLLNISVKTKYVLLDFSFPSIRYMSDFDEYHRWTGMFIASGSYITP